MCKKHKELYRRTKGEISMNEMNIIRIMWIDGFPYVEVSTRDNFSAQELIDSINIKEVN